MSTEFQQLVSDNRDLIAQARELLAKRRTDAGEEIASNIRLSVQSREAIARSKARLAEARQRE